MSITRIQELVLIVKVLEVKQAELIALESNVSENYWQARIELLDCLHNAHTSLQLAVTEYLKELSNKAEAERIEAFIIDRGKEEHIARKHNK
jgi:hypothetical protein